MDLKTINRAYKHARTGDTYDVMISDAEEHIKRCCTGYDRYSLVGNRILDQLRKEKEEELQLVDQVVAWANDQPEPIRGIVLDRVEKGKTWEKIAEIRNYSRTWPVITLRKYCEAESRAERGA
ncbi:MAG: hypothetical protein Q4F09_04605 [Erysipelotrichaceae bacterium]|nr:hypothetical protein [Erysipelotrichaceae bacterium]